MWRYALDVVYDRLNVFVYGEQMKLLGILLIFPRHTRASYQLQLVQLYHVEWKRGYASRLSYQFIMSLSRQSQYQVSSSENLSFVCPAYGVDCCGKVVSAVDAP